MRKREKHEQGWKEKNLCSVFSLSLLVWMERTGLEVGPVLHSQGPPAELFLVSLLSSPLTVTLLSPSPSPSLSLSLCLCLTPTLAICISLSSFEQKYTTHPACCRYWAKSSLPPSPTPKTSHSLPPSQTLFPKLALTDDSQAHHTETARVHKQIKCSPFFTTHTHTHTQDHSRDCPRLKPSEMDITPPFLHRFGAAAERFSGSPFWFSLTLRRKRER